MKCLTNRFCGVGSGREITFFISLCLGEKPELVGEADEAAVLLILMTANKVISQLAGCKFVKTLQAGNISCFQSEPLNRFIFYSRSTLSVLVVGRRSKTGTR